MSLQGLDPAALLALRTLGICTFSLPEVLFDLDFPGHYLRRNKGVTVSMPSVTGPYEGMNATLARAVLQAALDEVFGWARGTARERLGLEDARPGR